MGCFVALGFTLHAPSPHLFLMCTRLLKLVNKSNRAYVGEDMLEMHASDLQYVIGYSELLILCLNVYYSIMLLRYEALDFFHHAL